MIINNALQENDCFAARYLSRKGRANQMTAFVICTTKINGNNLCILHLATN